MTQVNMFEAKTELTRLIKMLENNEEDVIYIARNGIGVAQLTLIPKQIVEKRIGIAAGKLVLPDDFDSSFDAIDEDIAADLENGGAL